MSSSRRPALGVAPGAGYLGAILTLVLTLGALWATASPSSAAPEGPPTGGCRNLGGGAVPSPGPSRATVIIDTDDGEVRSVCISFSGSITGTEALGIAAAQIGEAAPVYERYGQYGRAVCEFRGVGNSPPNCMSKTVEYWSYHHNGVYSRVGASTSTVNDGDVVGWAWGRGRAPGAATAGTETTAAVAPPTTDPRPIPPPPAPEPDPAGSGDGGALPAPDRPSGDQPAPGGPSDDPALTGEEPEAETSDSGADPEDLEEPDAITPPAEADDPGATDLTASAAGSVEGPVGAVPPRTDASGSGSRVGSMVGFGAAMALVALAAVVVRLRTRTGTPS